MIGAFLVASAVVPLVGGTFLGVIAWVLWRSRGDAARARRAGAAVLLQVLGGGCAAGAPVVLSADLDATASSLAALAALFLMVGNLMHADSVHIGPVRGGLIYIGGLLGFLGLVLVTARVPGPPMPGFAMLGAVAWIGGSGGAIALIGQTLSAETDRAELE